MPGGSEAASRYRSQLSVDVPEGWTVSEGLTVVSPSGLKVRIRLDGVEPNTPPEQLTKLQLEQVSTVVESLDEVGDSTTSTASGNGSHTRDFEFRTDTGEFQATVTSTVVGNAAVVSSTSWPAADPPAQAEVDQARKLSSQVSLAGSEVDMSAAVSVWSEDELSYLGAISGSIGGFPTVRADLYPGDGVESGALSEVAETVYSSVVKSLAARSLIRSTDGAIEPLGMYATIGRLAFGADLIVRIESAGDRGISETWLGIGEPGALVVSVLDHGARQCLVLDGADPVDVIVELSGMGKALTRSAESNDDVVESLTLATQDLLDGKSEVEFLVSVQTSWRHDTATLGGLLTFASAADGAYLAEPDTVPATSWALTPIDEPSLRDLLISHLPPVLNRA